MKYPLAVLAIVFVILINIALIRQFFRSPRQRLEGIAGGTQTEIQLLETSNESAQEGDKTTKSYAGPPEMTLRADASYSAMFITTKGAMTIELFAKEAPRTVNNFVFLARESFYNGTVFHRIIKGFMIQGGDPKGDGTGGPGYQFDDEPVTREYVRGTIAMANAGPNTNGSQFFIVHEDSSLPKNYVIFGRIRPDDTKSLSVLDAIAETPVELSASGELSKPRERVILERVEITEE